MLILELIFVALVIADTAFTYYLFLHGHFREVGPLMRYIIKYPIFAIVVTVVGTLLVLLLIEESGFYLWLIPLCLGLVYVLWRNYKMWRA